MGMTEPVTETEAEVEKGIRGKLVQDLKAVVADAEELLKAAKVRLAEQEGAVMGKTKAAAKATEDYVRANPWKAVGIAAAVGFVLCLLATRLGQSVIEAGETVIIQGSRAIRGLGKGLQKPFK